MSFRALKPAQLRLVHEIALHGQLQMAADQLAMTQPAASRMLADAERQVGAALFTRQPKGMEPTEIGTAVLRRARVILREMASIEADVNALRGGYAGSVRVGAVTGPAISYLVSAIRSIKEESPGADITVDVMPSRELLMQLAAGEMDFVLGRILPDFDSDSFNILPMSDEKVALMARADHPLARAQLVTLTELAGQEWIMQQRGAPIREATLAAFAGVGLSEPANIVNSPSLLLTIAYLAQTNAITPVSHEVAELLIQPPVGAGFTIIPTPRPIRVSPYFLLDLKRRPLSPLAKRLRDAVAQMSRSPIRDAAAL
ncbi:MULTISPECIES: LysR family transcriptional regulator [Paracoccus]|uniref:LysR family transcriptional regulator n=1 Tax=Paracoccus aerius TaxID=1915382 RepID=A0ABS1S4R9_9RHOB|nr:MULTISPECIES: LysR family transcriptional regulator [Paracoccus]MBL3673134.1 LysR family transcriptional regulator [Paracoccus aerius]QIR85880.1 LysR family transcriptional regulator [Paracoccus sp. AK26]GHG18104.1 LysR family transcriptional regulator [Paracoccus aerius]